MRKLALLMCFIVLTMYTFNISLFSEDSTASREQPVVNESGDRNPVIDTSESTDTSDIVDTSDTFDIDEDLEYIDIAMDATFVKD